MKFIKLFEEFQYASSFDNGGNPQTAQPKKFI